MKLSAPPPPPPEDDGRNPGGGAPGTPTDTAPTVPAGVDTPGLPAPPGPPAVAATKPATWPAWFASADAVLALLAGTVAFLAASFAARNNDLWLHLGAGRMLTTGEYSLGSDPLSYTAADRPWVNHSWLWDLGSYLLYSGDGFALVLAKALAVAAAFGLLLGIRRPPHALWPWAVTAAVAAVACAPRLTLHPIIGSVFFLSATLFVLFRVPSRPGSWRTPLLLGGIFWLWANVDAWFFLGPVALGLLLVGELVRGKARTAEDQADPLPLPDATTLGRALLVGIAACMLNPHHVRVWQVPFELAEAVLGAAGLSDDPRLAPLRHLPFSTTYWGNDSLGRNVNGLAFALLLVAGLYAAFLSGAVGALLGRPWDVDPLPLPHAALWFGFAALSFLSVYAVPFLAVVTVPLVASRVNLFSARIELGGRADRNTRLVLTGSAAGRALTGLALVGLCLAAWPGWLQPPASNWAGPGLDDPAAARRVAWAVEPDPELARAAAWFGEQRAGGRLPADTRGIIASVELANYCAWYAPNEKVFLNGRYNHHRPELPDFLAVRAETEVRPGAETPPDPRRAGEVLDARRAGYLAVYERNRQVGQLATLRRFGLPVPGLWDLFAAAGLWSPWYTDGRAAVFGWRPPPGTARPEWEGLRADPAALAFGPAARPLPPGPLQPPPPPRDAAADFLAAPRPAPAGADEALGWLDYKSVLVSRELVQQQVALLLELNVPGVAVPPVFAMWDKAANEQALQRGAAYPRPPRDGRFLAASVLAVQAARRAIAENPAHPDGYFALGRALAEPDLPLNPTEREVGRITAFRQALDRVPPPREFRRGVYATSPTLAALELSRLYLGRQLTQNDYQGISMDLAGVRNLVGEVVLVRQGRLFRVPNQLMQGGGVPPDAQIVARPVLFPPDLALKALADAGDYVAAEFGANPPAEVQNLAKGIDEQRKQLDALVRRQTERYLTDRQRVQKVKDQFRVARAHNLVGEALAILKNLKGDELGQEFGPEAPAVALEMVALELAVGRLEDAAADLAVLKDELAKLAAGPNPPPGVEALRELARLMEYQVHWLSGNYSDAGRALEDVDGRRVGAAPFPPPAEAVGPKTTPFVFPLTAAFGGVNRAADVAFWAAVREGQVDTARGRVMGDMDEASRFYFRRGLWAVLDGNPAAAKAYFLQARRSPPPGWDDLPAADPVPAREYARYIDEAEKRAAGK